MYICYIHIYLINLFVQVPKSKPKEPKKPPTPNVREVEMQNWKRRKSYDPMKAAMEGRRKAGLAKKVINTNLSPR